MEDVVRLARKHGLDGRCLESAEIEIALALRHDRGSFAIVFQCDNKGFFLPLGARPA